MLMDSAHLLTDVGRGAPGVNVWKWFAPREQPARRPFGFASASSAERLAPVEERVMDERPFSALLRFRGAEAEEGRRILLVAPLSGHFAFLLRDMVAGLAPHASVYVTDWVNARHVPVSEGDFGFYDNVAYVVEVLRALGPGAHVVALCQAVVPALAAVAILSDEDPALAPCSLTLIAGPVDPLANPTRVVRMLRERPLAWFREKVLQPVAHGYPGSDRLVYPASIQLHGLLAYFTRHLACRLELYDKVIQDDGADSARFPFLDLYASIMDLPAVYFLENTELIFQERSAWFGGLVWNDRPIDFGAIRRTALMTIEGERDDIAAPGQTSAAHGLCYRAPRRLRPRWVIARSGHFSLFHGWRWREEVMPRILTFMDQAEA